MNLKLKNVPGTLMTTDNLSKNLITLMREQGISESELARAIDIPYNTIHRLTSGFTSDPRLSTLKLIANYFNVSLDVLTEENNASLPGIFTSKENTPKFVPIFSLEDISNPEFLNQVDLSVWEKWQPIALSPSDGLSENTYGIESKRSMQPRFPMGTIFVVDPNQKPMDDDLVLVRIKETNAVSLRDLRIDPPSWQLLPVIESSIMLPYDAQEHEIIGVIILTMIQSRKF